MSVTARLFISPPKLDLGFNDVGQPDRFDNVGDENSEHAR